MTIAFELFKSTGMGRRPCQPGSPRPQRCRLVVNERSEDVLTANTFLLLRYLNPTIWLAPLLATAFAGINLSSVDWSKVQIEFFKKLQVPFPLRNQEGMPEIDVLINLWPLILLIECKYHSELEEESSSKRDQLIRYIDSAIYHYWATDARPEIYFLLLTDTVKEPELLTRYRDPQQILKRLTRARPFIDYQQASQMIAGNLGWATWSDILRILERQDLKEVHSIEALIIKDLVMYLTYKIGKTKRSWIKAKGR